MENLLQLAVPLIIGVAIGYFICKKYSGGNSEPPNVNPGDMQPPHGIISVDDAISLHKTYKDGRYSLINEAIGSSTNNKDFLDTQFVWFSYDKMRKYMRYLELVQKKNPNNANISGIRVYFGAYEKHELYPNQQTVFLTPTIDVNISEKHDNMKNLPFSIIPTNEDKPLIGRYKIIRKLFVEEYNPDKRFNAANIALASNETASESTNLVQKSAENDDDKGTSLSYNMGQLSPPPRN